MDLLLDQGFSPVTADLLRQRGIDAAHVREHGMANAPDEEILRHAEAAGAAVVTYDADFASLLARSGASRPSIIQIRVEGLQAERAADLVERVVRQVSAELPGGVAVSASRTRLRVHRLPLK